MHSITVELVLFSLLAIVPAGALSASPQGPSSEEVDGELAKVTVLVGGMMKSRSGAT